MHGFVLALNALSTLCVAAALGGAFVFYGTRKTRVLWLCAGFITTIAAFSVAMALQSVADLLSSLALVEPQGSDAGGGPGSSFSGTLGIVSLLLQAAGGVVHVALLPHFIYAINNRHPSELIQRLYLVIAALMGALAVLYVVRPALLWVGFVLTAMLFASIGWCIGRMVVWLIRRQSVSQELDTSTSLRAFVWISLGFLPLFVGDVVVGQTDAQPDLASVLKISAKTAEHHLYSAYQELSVNNRVQLFQILMAHR